MRRVRVEVRRAWNIYAALAASLAVALLAIPLVASFVAVCRAARSPVALGYMLLAITLTLLGHEAIHYAVARKLGVRGLRVKFHARMMALIVDYDSMSLGQYVAVALSPQILTILLMVSAILLPPSLKLVAVIVYASAVANIVGGVPDMFLSAYFSIKHPNATRLGLVYGEDGGIVGGFVEEPGRIVFYMF